MNQAFVSRHRQRGISLIGMLFVAFAVAAVGLLAVRTIPVWIEFQQVSKAAKAATAGKTVAEVRELFDKALQNDQVVNVTSRDIQVSREAERVIVFFAYDRTLPLYGPVYLLFKLQGRSS